MWLKIHSSWKKLPKLNPKKIKIKGKWAAHRWRRLLSCWIRMVEVEFAIHSLSSNIVFIWDIPSLICAYSTFNVSISEILSLICAYSTFIWSYSTFIACNSSWTDESEEDDGLELAEGSVLASRLVMTSLKIPEVISESDLFPFLIIEWIREGKVARKQKGEIAHHCSLFLLF